MPAAFVARCFAYRRVRQDRTVPDAFGGCAPTAPLQAKRRLNGRSPSAPPRQHTAPTMVKLGSLLGAAYRLKQRRKRLTHRRAHEGAHDAFARAWMRCTRTRGAAVPLKVRNAVDAARDQADNVELNLSGCATDDVVQDVCAALAEHPCVAKLNLTKSKALTPSSGAALVKLAEDQIRLVLTAPLAPRLDGSMTCRRLHGILGEPRGYGCVRRFKVDGRRIGVHHAQRLKQLERLLDYCNAKLTLRDAFFNKNRTDDPWHCVTGAWPCRCTTLGVRWTWCLPNSKVRTKKTRSPTPSRWTPSRAIASRCWCRRRRACLRL